MQNNLFIRKYGLTIVGFVISVSILLHSIINETDFFEKFVAYLSLVEQYEVDEFILPILIFCLFAFFDYRKRQKKHKIEHEKLLIYQAMLSSSHHVLNNFLNQMQIFKMTAENTPDFDPDVLKLYDDIIGSASKQIDDLGSISNIDEESIFNSVAPKGRSETK